MITLLRKFQGINYRRYITGINYVIFSRTGANTQKYSLTDGTSLPGTNFPLPSSGGTGAGNATYGLFVVGNSSQGTYKYAYSGDVVTGGASIGVAVATGTACAAGNAEICLVAPGSNTGNTNAMRRYVYAGDSVGAGTALSGSLLSSSATGNAQFAIFRYAAFQAATDRYDFAANTKSAGAALSMFNTEGRDGSSTGNGVFGLMTGNSTASQTWINKITFASNTCVLGTSLTPPRGSAGRGMAGNTEAGVFGMGGTSNPSLVYTYASETVASSSADFNGITGAGVCANPVGVNV